MGLWSGIKYALNSTLGTSEFKPLDKLISGQKLFIPSENIILHSFVQSPETINDVFNTPYFIPKLNGTLILNIAVFSGGTCRTYVYEDTEIIFDSGNETINGTRTYTLNVNIRAGKKYSIRVYENYHGISNVNDISFRGMVMDANYFEIESEE